MAVDLWRERLSQRLPLPGNQGIPIRSRPLHTRARDTFPAKRRKKRTLVLLPSGIIGATFRSHSAACWMQPEDKQLEKASINRSQGSLQGQAGALRLSFPNLTPHFRVG